MTWDAYEKDASPVPGSAMLGKGDAAYTLDGDALENPRGETVDAGAFVVESSTSIQQAYMRNTKLKTQLYFLSGNRLHGQSVYNLMGRLKSPESGVLRTGIYLPSF